MNNPSLKESRSIRIGLVLLTLSVLVSFANSFSGVFVLDDEASIVNNRSIREVAQMWSPPVNAGVGRRPFLNATFALNYAVSGLNVWSYHLINLGIHLAAAFTFFGILLRLLSHKSLSLGFRKQASTIALLITLLWSLNPIQTESVTYISQRAEELAGLFYLLTIYTFVLSAESLRPRRLQIVSVVFCFLGAFTKQTVVTAPLIILLLDRSFFSVTLTQAIRDRKAYYWGLLLSWIVVILSSLDVSQRGAGFDPHLTWWKYALISCRSIVVYLKLVFWPHPLIFDYGYQSVPSSAEIALGVGLLIFCALGIVFIYRRFPSIAFLAATFFILLSPTTSFVPVASQPIAENRLYLPLAVFEVIFVVGIYKLMPRLYIYVLGVLVIGFMGLTVRRNHVYSNELALWTDTVAKMPANFRARTNMGSTLLESGNAAAALTELKAALTIAPDYPEANNNLGYILMEARGTLPLAIKFFETALRTDSRYKDAHVNLGVALSIQGVDLKTAADHLTTAIGLDPWDATTYYDRGLVYLKMPLRHNDAHADFMKALELQPDFGPARAALSR